LTLTSHDDDVWNSMREVVLGILYFKP
jgi:hypothetical protein